MTSLTQSALVRSVWRASARVAVWGHAPMSPAGGPHWAVGTARPSSTRVVHGRHAVGPERRGSNWRDHWPPRLVSLTVQPRTQLHRAKAAMARFFMLFIR